MGKSIDSEVMKKAREAVKFIEEELPIRIKECKEEGHKEPHYFTFSIGSNNPPYIVDGMCNYCLSPISRYLNSKERKQIEDFRKSFYEPATI